MIIAFFIVSPGSVSAELLINPDFDKDDHPTLIYQIIQAVNTIAQDYPEVQGVAVTTEPLEENVLAVAMTTTQNEKVTEQWIIFNDHWMLDPAKFQDTVEYGAEINFYPALGKCTGVEFIAYHETAHIIHRASIGVDEEIAATFGRGETLRNILSGYSFDATGRFNPPEALANAFAAVICNGGNWAEQALFGILVD